MNNRYSTILAAAMMAAMLQSDPVIAGENGRSTYSPGTQGDFSLAVLPDVPGFYLRNELWHYTGENKYSAFNGALEVNADLAAWVEIPRVTWVSGWKWLGARHGAYLSLPLAYVEASARVDQTGADGVTIPSNDSGDRLGISDLYLAPLMLDWKVGSVNIMWLETVTIPNGLYDTDEFVNLSRNGFALNSSLAATWRHPAGGPEMDLRAGYIVNSENPDTDYRTGDELVTDWTAAWRLNQRWALGITGYAYEQITGDSGDGALLGDFKGRSAGAGPIARCILTPGDHRIAVVAKWLHELDAIRRFEGDLFFMALSTRL